MSVTADDIRVTFEDNGNDAKQGVERMNVGIIGFARAAGALAEAIAKVNQMAFEMDEEDE